MATKFQQGVKIAVEAEFCGVDRVICRQDGSVQCKRSYFYTFGNNPDKFAAIVTDRLNAAGVTGFVVYAEDKWAKWPKTSYFIATVCPVDAK